MLAVGFSLGLLFLAIFGTYALGMWYAGKLVADSLDSGCITRGNCLTGGTVLATFFALVMGSIAQGQIAPPLASFIAAKTALYPIMQVISRTPEIDALSDTGLKLEGKITGRIVLDEVHFAYPSRPDTLICKGYNLTIEPGETVAFVGRSGAGKR